MIIEDLTVEVIIRRRGVEVIRAQGLAAVPMHWGVGGNELAALIDAGGRRIVGFQYLPEIGHEPPRVDIFINEE